MHSEPTLSVLLDLYLDVRSSELAPATVALTRRAWKLLITIAGDCRLDEFATIHAEQFRGSLLRAYRPKSVESYLKSVHPVFRWWSRHHSGYVDPFDGMTRVRVPKERPVSYADAEVDALLEAATTTRDRLRIMLAKTTGMRRGEILNLTWADINFEQELIYVQPKVEKEKTWAWLPKDKDFRIVPMTQEVHDLLLKVQMELPTSQPYMCLSEERYSYLQWRRSRGRMSDRQRRCPDANNKPMKAIRKRAGVEGATLRHLRSTCFTRLAEKAVPMHVIQQVAGHSDITTTRRYYIRDKIQSLDLVRAAMSQSG